MDNLVIFFFAMRKGEEIPVPVKVEWNIPAMEYALRSAVLTANNLLTTLNTDIYQPKIIASIASKNPSADPMSFQQVQRITVEP